MVMDAITGYAINPVMMTGNNTINTSTDVAATQNMARETSSALGQESMQDSMAGATTNANIVPNTISSGYDSTPDTYPENGSTVNTSA